MNYTLIIKKVIIQKDSKNEDRKSLQDVLRIKTEAINNMSISPDGNTIQFMTYSAEGGN